MVYNRSPERVEEFKSYAKDNEVEEEHYEVVTDLKVIGEKWVIYLSSLLHTTSPLPLLCLLYPLGRRSEVSSLHSLPYTLPCYIELTDIRADIVVTSLGSDEAVEEVYAELFGGQEVCTFLFRCYSSGIETFIESRIDSDHEVSLWLKYGTDQQEQGGKGDGILPGGRGRSTIFVDTSTVRLSASFPYPSILPTSVSIFPYISPPQSRRTIIDYWRSRTQRLDKRKSLD
jgi:hypothetical protein